MIIECPHCDHRIEVVDDLAEGQHVRCPYCNAKFEFRTSGSSVVLENVSTTIETRKTEWKSYVAITLITLVVAAAVVLFMVMAFDGGNGWSVEKGVNDKGVREVRVTVSPVVKKDYLKDLYNKGFLMIVVRPDDVVADIYFADDKTLKDGIITYNRGSHYELYREGHWKKFREEVFEYVKGDSAKEIITYVGKFK